jgi:S-DNA-T family DNA segregation ATPase FtsK/SpoIIIE
VSRRVSEFVGVALFAAALIWIVALASYEPKDPVWFFSAGAHTAPANFAGRVGAFLAELSFQLVGYAAYLIPAFLVVTGWHYFWCRHVDAAATKAAELEVRANKRDRRALHPRPLRVANECHQ